MTGAPCWRLWLSSVLLLGEVGVSSPQEARTAVERLMALCESASSQTLLQEVRLHPQEARSAFQELLTRSVVSPSPSAERLALAYAEAWTDPFLLNRFRHFSGWSVGERRAMLAGDSLRNLGNAAYTAEGVEPAMALWRASLAKHEALGDTVGVARSLGNLGAGFYGAGALDSASVHYSRSRELALGVGDFSTAANALTMLATLSKETGDLAQAGVLYLRALETHQRLGALRSVAADRHNLGLLALELGDMEEARQEFERAIAASRRSGHRDDEADHLSSLADVALAEGGYAEAGAFLSQALALDEETGNRLGLAGVRHSLGLLAMARGDFRLAVSELSQAHSIYSEMGYSATAVAAQSDLARAHAAAGDLRRAVLEMREAFQAAVAAEMGPGVQAELELARGELNLLLNEYARARDHLRRAEELYRSLGDFSGIAAAQRGQAFVHLYQDDPEQALVVLRQALRSQQLWGSPRPAAITRLVLGAAEALAGDTAAARGVIADALDVFRAMDDPVAEASALVTLADLEADAGFRELADSLYLRGLLRVEGWDAPEVTWRLHLGRAHLFVRRGEPDSARVAFGRAVGVVESAVSTWPGSESTAGYLSDKWEAYDGLALAQRGLGDDSAAFVTSERLRARRLLSLLQRGRVATGVAHRGLDDREQDLRRRMAELSALSNPEDLGWGAFFRGSAVRRMSPGNAALALRETRREYEEVLEEIRDSSHPLSDLVVPQIVGWEKVAQRLDPDEVFLEYLLTDSAAMAFVISDRGFGVVGLAEGEEMLAELVGFLRAVLTSQPRAGGPELWQAPLRRLHQLLIEPVAAEGWLEGKTHLVIVPHGTLHYLPFSALLGSDGRYLVEKLDLSYTPSASVWVQLVDRSDRTPRQGIMVLAPRAQDLPGTALEARRILEAYPDEAVVRTGPEATEALFRLESNRYGIVHLATYGTLNRTNPLFSRVELNPSREHDGRLEVHELFELELGAHLVVLSACETGMATGSRADVPPGDDWVGFVRGFLAAGAQNVLGTLWRVEDRATAELMGEFYRALVSGSPPGEALADAQRIFLSRPEAAEPFFWAGFSLVGEGRGGG